MAQLGLPTSQVLNENGTLNLDWVTFLTKLISQAGVLNGPPCTVANLPARANNGEIRYATDLCVFNGTGTQEATGHGTGGLVTYCSSTGHWRVAGRNVIASA
jgi:hypothetical protein